MIEENQDVTEVKRPWYKRVIFPGLAKLDSVQKGLWKPDLADLEIFRILALVEGVIFIVSFASGSPFGPLSYWDGPMYVYVARTLYNIPKSGPDSHLFKRPPYYFACHLPGYPLVIRFFSKICFNQYWLGELLSILFNAMVITYVFRRLLTVYNCVEDPVFTTKVSLFIPIRLCLYKAVGASDPLYITFCFLSLIFFKTDQLIFLLLSMWGACYTRIEGPSIVGTIGLCYLLRLDIPRALFTALGFIATPSLMYLHHVKFGNYKAYFDYNSGQMDLIKYPLYHLFESSGNFEELLHAQSLLGLFLPFFVGTLILFSISVPFAIFSTVYILYCACINHPDLARYSLPGFTLALLVGFDSVISSPILKPRFHYFKIPVGVLVLLYFLSELGSNRANDEHFMKICDIIHHVYNGTDSF
ncbi:hypothetical protein TVAG_007560 [Trichomonas vaginalis G3]|uniref:Uncharacterized protein n=1 Tax=Trichomonas vaginalis (strain ATCC PRA-98 / G3) TaxID=412133 RepID=A2FSY3_TRIV3|nr:dolichyl-phosphate-mannose-glycolipid alpha-mannosyltransferase protein [Trichomonas vaginalis G3]EAX91979.1 hypothetical protein TVAG_007560 [Trichomonas vaginalis G3]KAI5531161.1 dolichyl-phosphate-mannose-glycolipid alpha-mannosyltransferase protein [Trichomonas vaginalis G3]|eukprot:XP_001304909.1 hypothetical protein [Trichomonas vaginalis G3]